MRAPKKVIAAMALATMIGGTGLQAFAADFEKVSGVDGQDPYQQTEKREDLTGGDLNNLTSQGEITVNGNFVRKISSFPDSPQKDGNYLRVTMPIDLTYTYNLDSDVLTSGKGDIINRSVYVQNRTDAEPIIDNKAISMSFVKLEDASQNKDMEYVKTVSDSSNKVQLPFQVLVTKDGKTVGEIPLADIKDTNIEKNTIKVDPNVDLKLEITPIASQVVTDHGKLLEDEESASVSHKMTMKFKYLGE